MTILALAMTTGQASWAKSSVHPDKVLNLAFEAPDDGFDMVKTYNFYSGSVAEAIFEPLYGVDIITRHQFTLLALKCRIWAEVDSRLDFKGIDFPILLNLG